MGILNTEPEQIYDDLALLASAICETPMAFISFVDEDHKWLKARVGLEFSGLPRDLSISCYLFLHPESVMEVEDLLEDSRFTWHPLVRDGLKIRFYAAAPIFDRNGLVLGELGIIDMKPRRLTEFQRTALECLARQAAAHLALREADRFKETAFAVRLAQLSMDAAGETDLPLCSFSQPLTDAGGDAFHSFKLRDGSRLLVLADVAGHSVATSFAVAALLGMVSALSLDFQDVRSFVLKLNDCLHRGPFSETPVCTLAAHWDVSRGRLHIVNAGLPHGLWWRAATGTNTELELNGTPLGILETPLVEERVVQLQHRDRLLFASDGLFEMRSPQGRLFEEIAAERWSGLAGRSLWYALPHLCAEARAHGGGELQDDLLAVAIEQPRIAQRPSEFRMHLDSNFSAIDLACDRLAAFIAAQPGLRALPVDWHFDVGLVAREALTNAVIHGNRELAGRSVCFQGCYDAERNLLRIAVTDEALGADNTSYAGAADMQTSERGRGLAIIRAFTSSASMIGGELTLEFRLGETSNDQR